ncbi:Hypothetical predicted protein [Paramuricea clavata]|uniref:Uncharacterized protein n=1 Tax=Paramuricea clavata TaxID=317549 RepID=A0A7D9HNE5_PARCT|nr:Hypothetical predicted protein [Paramuricea clavata]
MASSLISGSPIKGLPVREDDGGKRALHTKVAKDRYRCISNFYFDLKAFVKFPADHNKYNGFIVVVHRIDGVSMECFLTIDEMENVKKFKGAINRSFSSKGGIMAHGINDNQLSSYIMGKMQEFALRGGKEMDGSLVIGRQPNFRSVNARGEFLDDDDPTGLAQKVDDPDTAVYILNDRLQINKDGVVPESHWRYRYMVPFLRNMPSAIADKKVKNFLQCHEVHVDLPLRFFDWELFISKAKTFFNVNFLPFAMFLSGGLATFHYNKIISCIGACPVPTAIGHPSSGKSTALKIICELAGMHMISQSSGEFVVSGLVNTTIPLCWDDPALPSMVSQPLVAVFNGLGSQTQQRGCEKPLTSFLLTVNFKLDSDMRSFERTTPIFFQRLKTEEGEQVKDYLDRKAELFSLASTRSLPVIIALSERLNKRILAQHIQFFRDRLHGLPPCLGDIYSVYRLILFEIIELVDNPNVIDCQMVDEFLKENFLPYVRSLYDVLTETELADRFTASC